MAFDIISIGSSTRDNFLESDYKKIQWQDAPLGEAIVFPFGEKFSVEKLYATIGGNAVNASVTFSRQGFKSGCFGKIGDDLAGCELIERLKKEKVKPFFAISDELPTSYSVLLLKDGERTILTYHGAANDLTLNDIFWRKLKAKWWYLSLSGEAVKLFKPLVDFAYKNKIKIAFNPSGYHLKNNKQEILNNLKYLDFLVLNEGEAAELVDIAFSKEREVFKKIDELMSPGIVAVTNGSSGATVSDGKNIFRSGIFPEHKLADRTGAGDAFGSGFVAGLMRQAGKFDVEEIKYAIRLATANAAVVVEQVGATEGIITKKEFDFSERFKFINIKVEKL